MASPFVEMINSIHLKLQFSQQQICSSRNSLISRQPTDEATSMLSTGIDEMTDVLSLLNELKKTVLLMDNAVFNASVNVEYAIGLLDMVKQTLPERQHIAMEALSSFNEAAFKMLENAWALEKAAGQAMEEEA